jgi:lipopolysaccharide transport system ATP-binding protein
MSELAIRVERLGKQYHIGRLKQSDQTMVETALRTMAGPLRRTAKVLRGQHTGAAELDDTIWALKDISFQVEQGEVVGIIGRNGAGKSTLLKLLSRITYPTTGRIEIYGRVGSLLEVGTGFHQELTGRENVYLNGAVLGMTRQEIDRKFDEIVAFSGVEKFIDTPVKHYSSGMSVRLAFAVAAYLEPDILLVDEVLAVGDVRFREKSMGRMSEIASEGRTVLFVSHNMGAISNLCERVLLLREGQIVKSGTPAEVIPEYLALDTPSEARVRLNAGDPHTALFEEIGICNADGLFINDLEVNKPFEIYAKYRIIRPLNSAQVGFAVVARDTGTTVFVTTHADTLEIANPILLPGAYTARVPIPGHFLNAGSYVVNARIFGIAGAEARIAHATAMQAISLHIHETGSVATHLYDRRGGLVIPRLKWIIEETSE